MTDKKQLVSIAKAVLDKKINFIEASRLFVKLRYEKNVEDEKNLDIFRIIDSETDHLSIGNSTENCSESLQEKTALEIEECEKFYYDEVITSCKNLITKYS